MTPWWQQGDTLLRARSTVQAMSKCLWTWLIRRGLSWESAQSLRSWWTKLEMTKYSWYGSISITSAERWNTKTSPSLWTLWRISSTASTPSKCPWTTAWIKEKNTLNRPARLSSFRLEPLEPTAWIALTEPMWFSQSSVETLLTDSSLLWRSRDSQGEIHSRSSLANLKRASERLGLTMPTTSVYYTLVLQLWRRISPEQAKGQPEGLLMMDIIQSLDTISTTIAMDTTTIAWTSLWEDWLLHPRFLQEDT
jgi:hypothetical protein